jgi:hypothetical protein
VPEVGKRARRSRREAPKVERLIPAPALERAGASESAGGGNRTHTGGDPHGILSPYDFDNRSAIYLYLAHCGQQRLCRRPFCALSKRQHR